MHIAAFKKEMLITLSRWSTKIVFVGFSGV